MIKYKFIYEEVNDDTDLDLAGIPDRYVELVVSGTDDKRWDELLPHFRSWLISVGFNLEGIKIEGVRQ